MKVPGDGQGTHRSASSIHRYFRMGVREVWTWSRRDGVHIRVADAESERQFRESNRSRVLPGLHRDDLDELLGARSPSDSSQRSRRLARHVVRAMLASRAAG